MNLFYFSCLFSSVFHPFFHFISTGNMGLLLNSIFLPFKCGCFKKPAIISISKGVLFSESGYPALKIRFYLFEDTHNRFLKGLSPSTTFPPRLFLSVCSGLSLRARSLAQLTFSCLFLFKNGAPVSSKLMKAPRLLFSLEGDPAGQFLKTRLFPLYKHFQVFSCGLWHSL